MNSHRKSTIKVYLELTEEEARWLNAVMQNPLHGEEPEEEAEENRQMRRKFFEHTQL